MTTLALIYMFAVPAACALLAVFAPHAPRN